MTAYYNEIDPYAAAWLRNLIAAGHIAPGDVDERSIEDVSPDDLRPYTQCHFFAGIGVWSYALRRAGWSDDRPVWTGSCPCQPFSAAGKGGGFADERHLWPAFHHLIRECGPGVVLGEQVASKDGLAWLDLVQADLEGSAYASGAVDLCAAGVGAPHIRQRLWWCAERLAKPEHGGREAWRSEGRGPVAVVPPGVVVGLAYHVCGERPEGRTDGNTYHPEGRHDAEPRDRRHPGLCGGRTGRLADDCGQGRQFERQEQRGDATQPRQQAPCGHDVGGRDGSSGLADVSEPRWHEQPIGHARADGWQAAQSGRLHPAGRLGHSERLGTGRDAGASAGAEGGPVLRGIGHNSGTSGPDGRPGPTNGLWRDADWLFCRDGKWRPVEPGTFPLAHGAASRVGRLRAYGNAIVAQAAEEFIRAFLEAEASRHFRMTEMSVLTANEGIFA